MRSVVRAPRRVKQTAFPNIPVYVSMVRMKIEITPRLSVSEEELKIEYVRAPGPGGQNVNKVATAVQLRFDVRHSPSLPEDVRRRLGRLAGRRLTSEGVVVIHAHARRPQGQKRGDG